MYPLDRARPDFTQNRYDYDIFVTVRNVCVVVYRGDRQGSGEPSQCWDC